MDHKYDVFISYSRKDAAIADQICAALDDQGISYFIDRQSISGGLEFPKVLAEAINGCRIMLYLASLNSYKSKFTNNEVTFAYTEKPEGSILPYIIDGSRLPTEQRLVLANVNIRTIEDHPIQTVLMQDLCKLLQRSYKTPSTAKAPSGNQPKVALATMASTFNVVLRSAGWAKLQVVKAVKEGLGLGLKEAKELVDSAPSVLKENIEFASASALKSFLEEVGAQVEIKPNKSVIGKSTSQTTMLNSVLLVTAGSYKLQMVKTIKETLGIGLKEAKDLVDEAPSILRKGLQTWEAQVIKRELEAQGAVVEICSDDMAESNQRKHIARKETNQNKIKAAQISKEADKEYDAKRFATAMALYFKAVNLSDEYEYYLYDCSRIAYCYCIGQGVDKNYYEAAKWYRIAANRGYANAQLNLGTLYRNGQGVTKNLAEAARWYQKAAEQGDATAKKYLAELKPYL